jgi:hypothetical protein
MVEAQTITRDDKSDSGNNSDGDNAKLGSHGDKDIAKVMDITNGSTKRGS